ncbi:unnamed protein product [Brassicogethes aeneus]|uniref:Uncharacterized protein n=1 Tax=Brassicogethes aeneus TaxID=1431903 RepID=A0A9P0FLF5_BRAAE|nr:unnamed protein product [Brassicogethes aeneus]
MFRFVILYFSLLVFCASSKSLPNDRAVLISKYAKVAVYGQNDSQKHPTEGRSSGQSLWSYRSDVNVKSGQNAKKNRPQIVTYRYPVSRKGNDKVEGLPGIGEVIQERFNPKPYFKYGQIPPQEDSYPVYAHPAQVDAKPSTAQNSSPTNGGDLYTSPYTSYNPPNVSTANYDAPSNAAQPEPTKDSYAEPPAKAHEEVVYDYKPTPVFTSPSLGPPLAPPADGDDEHFHEEGPPKFPPKSIDDIYYPPDDHDEKIVDHHPAPVDMAEEDLSPPPSGGIENDPPFPQYLYDGHHHDHHVYEEIHHPTTAAPEKEDKRVSGSHYSYYYLGRKLWYIPLYFSIYFILYVTLLILKSIARHKIKVKHDFLDDKRKARTMDFHETINDMHRNVSSAIQSAENKYMAM